MKRYEVQRWLQDYKLSNIVVKSLCRGFDGVDGGQSRGFEPVDFYVVPLDLGA